MIALALIAWHLSGRQAHAEIRAEIRSIDQQIKGMQAEKQVLDRAIEDILTDAGLRRPWYLSELTNHPPLGTGPGFPLAG